MTKNLLIIPYSFLIILTGGFSNLNAQLKTIFKSNSLIIYVNDDSISNTSKITKIKFVSSFNDSIQLLLSGKCQFSGYVKTERSTGIAVEIPYIQTLVKKDAKLQINFLNENFKITTKAMRGYNFLYIYKRNKEVTLYYKNEELFFE